MTTLSPLSKISLAVALLACNVCAQDRSGPSRIPIHNLTLKSHQIDLALQDLAKQKKVVIGLEYEQRGGKQHEISVHVEDGTLADALDAIVNSNPEYAWIEEPDGAIRVYSRDGAPTLPNVSVANFTVESAPAVQVLEMIDRLPEVKRWTASNHCPQHTPIAILGGQLSEDPQISLSLSQISVRQLLGALALKSGDYFWAVDQYYVDGQCFNSIHF